MEGGFIMPIVTFMRHAKTTQNTAGKFTGQTDCDTTKEGLELARKNFKFTAEDFDHYICSSLRRTVQTLNAVIPGQTPIIDKRIAERYLGDWENLPHDSIDQALIQSYIKGYYDPPKSEPYSAVKKRVCAFVEDLFKNYKTEDRILVVTHAGVLRQVRDNFLPDMDKAPMPNAFVLTVTNEDFERYMEKKEKEQQAR